jgi:alkylation response protein AidB-like acyl-CoA dehydrogenase
MDMIANEARLPSDIDAQPLVRAAAALQPGLRGYHEEIEREQRLPPGLVEQLNAVGFYRMVIPRALGGLQVDPLTYLRVVELLAEGVGSVGWNIANNSVGQLVTLGLPDEGVNEIYANGADTVIAGTAVPGGGQAVPVEGGYRVSGRWSFGSGCREAAWMLGSFQIADSDCPTVADPRGRPRRSPDGKPLYWRGVFPRAEAEIVPGSWDVAGLRGTGSFDWTVEEVFLPERRTMPHAGIPLDNQWKRWPGVTYSLPVQCWVGPHHSAVITGIARAGIDALIELAGGKTPRGRGPGLLCDNPQVQDAVGRADAILNAGRAYRTAMIAELWNTVAAGKDTTLEQRARCRLASTYAGDSAREAMDLVYRHGGSTSFQRASRLAECWRDLHTVGQTVTIAPEWYPIGGRVYLGMDPGQRLR